MTKIEKYYSARNRLRQTPAGCGLDYHSAIYHVARLGSEGHVDPDTVIADIASNTVKGARPVGLHEIQETVSNAYSIAFNRVRGGNPRKKSPATLPDARLLDEFVADYVGATAADITSASPVAIPDEPADHWSIVLDKLYRPEEYLFIGPAEGSGESFVKQVAEWRFLLGIDVHGLPNLPHVIVNSLTGSKAPCKNGVKMSMRADANVAEHRSAVIEFDGVPVEKQFAFWAAMLSMQFPIAALVHSGGKSVHGWVHVGCRSYQEWQTKVDDGLFMNMLVPLGADRMCRNPSRMSRLPGHFRRDKGQWQRLIYLNSCTGALCAQ